MFSAGVRLSWPYVARYGGNESEDDTTDLRAHGTTDAVSARVRSARTSVTERSDAGPTHIFGGESLMFEFIRPAVDSRPVIRFAGREAGAGDWEVTFRCVWDGPRETFVRKERFTWVGPARTPTPIP